MWLLLLRDKKGDLIRGLDNLAVLKENSCSMIQSRPLELVFFSSEVGQVLTSQFRMNLGKVLPKLEGFHALVSKCLLADDALWQLHAIVHDKCEAKVEKTFVVCAFLRHLKISSIRTSCTTNSHSIHTVL